MPYLFEYQLSPVVKQGLNESLEISVLVKHPNQQPAPGINVSLKLVKNTSSKIKSIKSNVDPEGFINSLINPNAEQKGCFWQSTSQFDQIFEIKEQIIDFAISNACKIICTSSEGLYFSEDRKILQLKQNQKVLFTNNGDYVTFTNNKIQKIIPALSNHIQDFILQEQILNISVDDKDNLAVLHKTGYSTIERNKISYFNITLNSSKIHFYKGKVYLIDDLDCSIINQGKIIDGFNLAQEKIIWFQGNQQYLFYCLESMQCIYAFNVLTKEIKEIPLHFMGFIPDNLKVDLDFNVYFSLNNKIFKIKNKTIIPEIDIIFDNEPTLEAFSITTSGLGKMSIYAKNTKSEWLAWEQYTDTELKTYQIPIENKISQIRISWEGYSNRTITSIFDFLIQGSSNFGQILNPIGLTDDTGTVKFNYIARQINHSEKFMAVVR